MSEWNGRIEKSVNAWKNIYDIKVPKIVKTENQLMKLFSEWRGSYQFERNQKFQILNRMSLSRILEIGRQFKGIYCLESKHERHDIRYFLLFYWACVHDRENGSMREMNDDSYEYLILRLLRMERLKEYFDIGKLDTLLSYTRSGDFITKVLAMHYCTRLVK